MSDDEILPNGNTPSPKAANPVRRNVANHPTYLDMVVEAVKNLDEKKGASVIAVKQWIIHSYPEIDQSRLKGLLRMALQKGVKTGVIVRPKKSESLGTLSGRYKLGKPPKPAKKKAAGENKNKKVPAKERKKSDQDVFDYSSDEEQSADETGVPKKRGKSQKAQRPRSASASSTPKPRASKSKLARRSKSHSPAPSKLKAKLKASKAKKSSPVKRASSKSPSAKSKGKSKEQSTAKPKAKSKSKAAENSGKSVTPKKNATKKKTTKSPKKKVTKK